MDFPVWVTQERVFAVVVIWLLWVIGSKISEVGERIEGVSYLLRQSPSWRAQAERARAEREDGHVDHDEMMRASAAAKGQISER